MPAALADNSQRLIAQMLVRFTKDELSRIVELAEEHGVSQSRVIRVAVLQMFERMDSEPPSPSRKKRRKKP